MKLFVRSSHRWLVLGWLVVPIALAAGDLPFSPELVTGATNGAHDVVIADIDGDGDLDLVGVANFSDTVSWWENGNAWAATSIDAAFNDARGLDVGDMDGDGDLDVVATSHTNGVVAWWENTTGLGTTWTERSIDTDFIGARSVVVADLDGDGDLDAAGVAEIADQTAWWQNVDGLGTVWSKQIVDNMFDGGHAITAGDIDLDGDLDLAGAAVDSDAVVWWENVTGDGSSWAVGLVDLSFAGARGISTADIDGDGDTDLLAAARDDDEIRWYENLDGAGNGWSPHTIDGGFDGAIDALGTDLDQDGDTDVVAAGVLADEIAWWENTAGDGSAWTEHKVDVSVDGPFSVAVADINGDGDPDVASAAFTDDAVLWWSNDVLHRSSIFPIDRTVTSDTQEPESVRAGDIDRDGDLDLVGVSEFGDVLWWENTNGAGTAWIERIIGSVTESFDLSLADLDSDGDLDAVVTDFTSDDIVWYENLDGVGLTWIQRIVDTFFNGAYGVAVADFDGDGTRDIAVAGNVGDQIAWWSNDNGAGTAWTETTIDGSADGAVLIEASDFDGDGDTDLVAALETADDVTWYENFAGDGSLWIERIIDGNFDGAQAVATADIDGDGDSDVVAAAFDGDDIAWFENADGNGTTWVERTVDANVNGPVDVQATDLDADGDIDLFAAVNVGDEILWWENLGSGGSWTKRTIRSGFNGADSVQPADMNGDGLLDIVSTADINDLVVWFENVGGQTSLETTDTAPNVLSDGAQDAIFELVVFHEGRAGDADAELASLQLLFEESDGDPLTTTEVGALLAAVDVYLDDGSGEFDGADTLLGGITTFALSSGVQSVSLPDDLADLQVPFGATKTYWITLTAAPDAGMQNPNSFQVTHLATATGLEDAENDIPLTVQFRPNTTSKTITAGGDIPTLSAAGDCPGPLTIAIEGATPGGNVSVIFSQAEGSFVLPFGNCIGTEFGLDSPSLLFTLIADVDGNAQITGNAPASACGAFLQAMDVSSCIPTNVFQVQK